MSSENNRCCPSCGTKSVHDLGPIPASNSFAGRQLDHVMLGGGLWRCSMCHLLFRYPRLSKQDYDNLYLQGHSENWPDQVENRADWLMALKIIGNYPEIKRVLDVGCFDGKFLDHLDKSYKKLGVEIHAGAAKRAKERNIRIIAQDFDELSKHCSVADAVMAIDVIEHTDDPMKFLDQLVQTVSPGGLVIVASGNTDSLSWRFMGSRYWYCHIAEHISFINPEWAYHAAHQLRLEVVAMKTFSHGRRSAKWGSRVRETLLNIFYRTSPWLFSEIRRLGAGGIDVARFPELLEVPPYWLTAQDHILVVFKKKEA